MRVSASLLGNGHSAKFMAMDRGTVGNHTACTKERFVIYIDHATRRHAALPAESRLLTLQQARTFGWVALLDAPAAAQAPRVGEGRRSGRGVGSTFSGWRLRGRPWRLQGGIPRWRIIRAPMPEASF